MSLKTATYGLSDGARGGGFAASPGGPRPGPGARWTKFSCLLLVLCLFPWREADCVETDEAQPEVWIHTTRQSAELPEASLLRVSNQLGDVRGRSSGDGTLLVAATIQRFAPDQADAEVLITHEDGAVVVRTRYPSAEQRRPDGRLNGRIDLAVLVPAGGRMVVETDDGLVEVKGVDRDLSAKTGSGRLRVTTRRGLEAETREGELVAVIRNPAAESPARVVTESGRIHVDVLNRPDLTLFVRSKGSIRKRLDAYPGAALVSEGEVSELKLGEAPWFLQASSATGSIDIRALPANELR
ncbi:MAG: hypothetical protein OSB70_00480 [Myxococcota bacterium]|nr:hypothetical protein [Myxococcota bacterium]